MESEERIKQLENFLNEDPKDPFIIFALAMEHVTINKKKTKELFEILLKDHPDYMGTYYHAAALFSEIGERHSAEEVYKRGISVAESQNDQHALKELKSAYQNFLFEDD